MGTAALRQQQHRRSACQGSRLSRPWAPGWSKLRRALGSPPCSTLISQQRCSDGPQGPAHRRMPPQGDEAQSGERLALAPPTPPCSRRAARPPKVDQAEGAAALPD